MSVFGATQRVSRLLVVDDLPGNVQALFHVLGREHEVFAAASGEAALKFCDEELPDLILLDVVMPGMDGHEVCRRLKADPRTASVPVIFVTSQDAPDEEALGLDLGAVDFISRPLNPRVVQARVRAHLALKLHSDLLRSLALIDGLTGVANRRHFDEALEREWRDCRRRGRPLSLLLIDIDYFKAYNDHYGHQEGDTCLRAVASALDACLGRAHDLVARFGGEEFACLLPDCDRTGAAVKIDHLLDAVRSLAIPHAAVPGGLVTVSLGASTVVPSGSMQPETLLRAADQHLYKAKNSGRNRAHSAVDFPVA